MSVQDLINELNGIKDKSMPIYLWVDGDRYDIHFIDESIKNYIDINARLDDEDE